MLNTGGKTDVMTKMAKDIDTQIENAQLSKSNIVLEEQIELQVIMISIIQHGLVAMLNYQSGYNQNKHVSTLKMKIKSVLNSVFNALFLKPLRKTIHIHLFTIRILEIILLIGDV